MDKNILDKATDKLLSTLMRVDEKAKNTPYYPYNTEKATAQEKREHFENLDVGQLTQMIEKHGREETNKYLRKFMGGKNGMV